jgi:hypothetical protein
MNLEEEKYKEIIEYLTEKGISFPDFVDIAINKEYKRLRGLVKKNFALIGERIKNGKTTADLLVEVETEKTMKELKKLNNDFIGYQKYTWRRI